jgi:hypothetical protein
MNPPPESFDALRRLLALKRHEQPPPGYFARFPDRVLSRIEAEGDRLQPSWWQQLRGALEVRPLAALAYGAVALGLFAVGASASRYLEVDQSAAAAVPSPWVAVNSLPLPEETPAAMSRAVLSPVDSSCSVNPVLAANPPHALFDVNRLSVQRAAYSPR